MEIIGFRIRQLLGVPLLFFILLAVFPGTGGAEKPKGATSQVPEVFRQLEARVVGLRFYATETSKGAPMPARAYNTDFIRSDTHYIWWELQLNAKAKRDKPLRLFIKAVWQRPDGTEFKQSHTVTIPADIQHPALAAGWNPKPGAWLPGTYHVVIHVDEIPVAKGDFEVFEKLLKKP